MNNQEHSKKVKELTDTYFNAMDKSISDSIPDLEKIVKDECNFFFFLNLF